MIDFIHADQPSCELKHVVTQRNDNELSVLGPFGNIRGDNGNLKV